MFTFPAALELLDRWVKPEQVDIFGWDEMPLGIDPGSNTGNVTLPSGAVVSRWQFERKWTSMVYQPGRHARVVNGERVLDAPGDGCGRQGAETALALLH